VRSTLPCELDLAYGQDPRHRIDWFPAAGAGSTLIFIHGGYWRALDKSMFSWLAAAYVAAGVNVAMVTYRLCPAVHIDEIVDDVVAAMNWLLGDRSPSPLGEGRGEGRRIVLAGHSAGGHLVAALFATARDRFAFDPARIAGGVCLSGLYDFAPLRLYSFNTDFRLDEDSVARLNLYDKKPQLAAPLVIAAGGAESSEFRRQSLLLSERWAPQARPTILLPGINHFSIVDAFAERGQVLHDETLKLLG
jgi:arylformamidase